MEFQEPNVGDYLITVKYGLIKVKERGVLERGPVRIIGLLNDSRYSIMENSDGNIIKNTDGQPSRFYDDFLTEDNFKIAKQPINSNY